MYPRKMYKVYWSSTVQEKMKYSISWCSGKPGILRPWAGAFLTRQRGSSSVWVSLKWRTNNYELQEQSTSLKIFWGIKLSHHNHFRSVMHNSQPFCFNSHLQDSSVIYSRDENENGKSWKLDNNFLLVWKQRPPQISSVPPPDIKKGEKK